MKFSFIWAFILGYLPLTVFSLIAGGWNVVENPNQNVNLREEVTWGGRQIFPGETVQFNIVSAQQQVVAGMNYRL